MADKERGKRSQYDRRKSDSNNWLMAERRTAPRRAGDKEVEDRRAEEDEGQIKQLPATIKIRTVYMIVSDMDAARNFYSNLLGQKPIKDGNVWCEFKLGNASFGLRLNDFKADYSGSSTIPVFEFYDTEIFDYIKKAKDLGAKVLLDALEDENMLSVVFKDPLGNKFEISKMHDF